MPSLKIVLLGDQQGQKAFVDEIIGALYGFTHNDSRVLRDESVTKLSYEEGGKETSLEIATPQYSQEAELKSALSTADIVLYTMPQQAEVLGNSASFTERLNKLKNDHSNAQFFIQFQGDGKTDEEKALQSRFPGFQALCFNHDQVKSQFLAFIATANAQKDQLAQPKKPIVLGHHDKVNGFSRFLGATLRLVFGAVMGLVVYNPISSVFAALSALQRDIAFKVDTNREKSEKILKIVGGFFILALSPVLGPLKGLFYDGIYRQMRRGWKEGFKSSWKPFVEMPQEANLNDFELRDFNEETVAQMSRTGTPISRRNIIAGIVIASLVIAAGLAVWLPVVNAVLAISAHAAQYGLGSLSLVQLALVASGAALIAGTFLYGLGVGAVKLAEIMTNAFSTEGTSNEYAPIKTSDEEPGKVSKFFGAVVGAIYGAVAGLVIYNPVTSLFIGARTLWQNSAKYRGDLLFTITVLTAFIWMPLAITLIDGLWGQGNCGWNNGLASILGFEAAEKSAGRKIYNIFNPKIRDVIAGLVITGLVVAAGLAFVLTPISIFLGIPALLTTYGLAGMAPWSLALIASGATLVATTLLYGIGSNTYDVWADRKSSLRSQDVTLAEDDEDVFVKKGSSAQTMEGMQRTPTRANIATCLSVLSGFMPTYVTSWWNGKNKADDAAASQPLLMEETAATAADGSTLRT